MARKNKKYDVSIIPIRNVNDLLGSKVSLEDSEKGI